MADNNTTAPAASYKFNSMQEIRSHSSILYNQRMAILFYLLDLKSVDVNKSYMVDDMLEMRALIKQIYKNIRMLIRFNPTMRVTMNLETQDPGIYVPDIMFATIDKLIDYCEVTGFTKKRLYIIVQELNNAEMIIKDILQYFHYFIRPEFKSKPDIELATERYKEIADNHTVEELRQIVGIKHKVDFGSLKIKKIKSPLEISDEHEDEDLEPISSAANVWYPNDLSLDDKDREST